MKHEKNVGEILKEVMPQDFIKFGLIPEFIGRVPVVVSLDALDEDALVRILQEPKNSLVKQYKALMDMDGVDLEFEPDALREVAKTAMERKTGARGLRSVIEKTMMDVMYEAPSNENMKKCVITKEDPHNNFSVSHFSQIRLFHIHELPFHCSRGLPEKDGTLPSHSLF